MLFDAFLSPKKQTAFQYLNAAQCRIRRSEPSSAASWRTTKKLEELTSNMTLVRDHVIFNPIG